MSVMKQIEEEKAKLHEQAIALESNLEVCCSMSGLHDLLWSTSEYCQGKGTNSCPASRERGTG